MRVAFEESEAEDVAETHILNGVPGHFGSRFFLEFIAPYCFLSPDGVFGRRFESLVSSKSAANLSLLVAKQVV